MPYVANELLDLPLGRGQRAETVDFDLIDRTGQRAGSLHPEASGASISFDATANIPRKLSGLRLSSSDYASIDPFGDQVAPFWRLSDETRWPLGRYRFTTAPDNGTIVQHGPLFDGMIVLDALTDRSFGVASNTSVSEAMQRLTMTLGLFPALLEGTDAVIGADQPIGWPTGGQSWAHILRYLCQLAGFLPPYFDNDGGLVLRAPSSPVIGPATLSYSTEDDRVHPEPISDPNLLDAPNAHIVVSTGASTEEIWAVAYVDPALPFSVEGRGYTVPKVHRMQGIANTAQAQVIANRLAQQGAEEYTAVQFVSAPDPRHDCFEVIGFDAVAYHETGYTLTLEPGGDHEHRGARSGDIGATV